MLPDDVLTPLTESERFLVHQNKQRTLLKSWSYGGVAISDTSEEFNYIWQGYVDDKSVYLQREGMPPDLIVMLGGKITEMSFAFDQNMSPVITYIEDDVCKMYWYDSEISSMSVTNFDDVTCPRLSLDDARQFNIANSDVIFAYISNFNRLCYRLQRERYSIEHELMVDSKRSSGWPLKLHAIGMNTSSRFMFKTN